jgi:hypothetical protein
MVVKSKKYVGKLNRNDSHGAQFNKQGGITDRR